MMQVKLGMWFASALVEPEARSLMARLTAGLTPSQMVLVAGLFFLTLIGALLLAWGFRWWNGRNARV